MSTESDIKAIIDEMSIESLAIIMVIMIAQLSGRLKKTGPSAFAHKVVIIQEKMSMEDKGGLEV